MPLFLSKTEGKQIVQLDTDCIKASEYQPRKMFSDRAIGELADSIKEHGILQPLLVVKNGKEYLLVAGERRLRAARLAGLESVPVIVTDMRERERAEVALIENIQREQLSFFEEAEGLRRLCDEFAMTQADIAKRLGRKQSTVSNKLRLLKLPLAAQVIITANGLTERHARELLRITDKGVLFTALDRIVSKKLNVSQTEEYIKTLLTPAPEKPQRLCKIKDVRIFINTINKAVDMIKKAGIKPLTELSESEGFVEYIIKIPKTS